MTLTEGSNVDDHSNRADRPTKARPTDSFAEQPTRGSDDTRVEAASGDHEIVNLESRYKIEGTLGQGGMGAVLLATDMRLGRRVAIKRIIGKGATSKASILRFMNEAKAIAALNHPNIVQIYDYGRAADGPFLIMEFVDGGTLSKRCTGQAMPLDEAIDLACQLCDGLAKAHAAGIIHRDIKPANVLLSADGHPKLSDFGLAKAETADHEMTTDGTVLGTPDFMAPEQRINATLVDARSDLWSLAATIYQMVTGKNPKIIRFDLVPTELTSVLAKALEESKEDRYQSAREFRDALRSALLATMPFGEVNPETESEFQDGQCTACGTVNSDVSRKFCKKCGASLRVACRQCDAQIPVWDTICGECGGSQSQLASTTDDEHEDWQSVVVGEGAAASDESDAMEDPLHAIDASGLLTGSHSPHEEFDALMTTIVDRIRQLDVDGLLPAVERALELGGDRPDLVEARNRLVERRDDRLAQARAALDADNPTGAAEVLQGADPADFPMPHELRDLLARVNEGVAFEQRLADAVRDAKSRKVVSPAEAVAILGLCRAYLKVVPKSDRIAKLKAQCEGLSSVTNSIGMKLRIMSPGTFMMGQSYGEEDETPHQVTLTKPFSIGVFLVTNAQWKHVMGTLPSHGQEDKGPVEQVSWDDAVDFCAKLSALPAERKAGRVYRLPTEAEWEYACRAGAKTNYSFGDDESWLGDHGWFDGNSENQTHAVGQKQPNPWGLYDMHGNVWEWCSDWCGDYSKGSVTDPCGAASGSRRVTRGGSCSSPAARCRSAFRYGLDPSCRIRSVGFRLALNSSVQG
jgi:formylglycine-generating enzyme required for sulfatase activity